MSPNYDEIQKMGKDQMQVVSSAASSMTNGLQSIAAETGEFSKKSFESGSAFFEKLLGAKSIEAAVQIQSEYARSAYESLVAQATKIGEIYSAMAKEAMRPLETAMGKAQAAA